MVSKFIPSQDALISLWSDMVQLLFRTLAFETFKKITKTQHGPVVLSLEGSERQAIEDGVRATYQINPKLKPPRERLKKVVMSYVPAHKHSMKLLFNFESKQQQIDYSISPEAALLAAQDFLSTRPIDAPTHLKAVTAESLAGAMARQTVTVVVDLDLSE